MTWYGMPCSTGAFRNVSCSSTSIKALANHACQVHIMEDLQYINYTTNVNVLAVMYIGHIV